MSKRKIVAWIKSDEGYSLKSSELKEMIRGALKEQDRDTRHACAEEVIKGAFWSDAADADVIRADHAHKSIINCNSGIDY